MLSVALAQASFPTDPKLLGQWMANYYVDDDAGHVADFLKALQSSGVLTTNPDAQAPISAFLAAVFSRHPERIRGWVTGIGFTGGSKGVVERALWLSHNNAVISDVFHDTPDYASQEPPSMMTIPLTNPGTFDMMWSTFFTTGDTKYPARLIDILDDTKSPTGNKTMDEVLRSTAAWSLSSNMRQHDRIFRLIQSEAAKRTGSAQQQLAKMLSGYAAERTPWPNQSGEFCAMLTLISEDNLKEFNKPSDQGVYLRELDKAKRGDHIAIKVTFAGIDLADDLSADVTYDLKVIPPDGIPAGALDQTGRVAMRSRVPSRFVVFDNLNVPVIYFDPDYPLGTYKVVVVVKDNIGHRSLSMSKDIELNK